ncbi:DUF6777 domain-containing protein, partial [Streptomyces bambusae]|uniref:DUF6777 domain-containing protein n=1 Tax=Streptomyces bambusae TaxID=1550616 RepID=UPI001CA5D84C
MATSVVALAAVVGLVLVLTRPSGSEGGELFLQPVAAEGPDPFTESTANAEEKPPPPEPATTGAKPPPEVKPASGKVTAQAVTGSDPTLYGGSQNTASCDIEKQVKVLSAAPAKNEAFAGSLGIQPAAVPSYLRSLTPVTLRHDTRVTNHGYRDGRTTSYQAVLQTGTAVLVDNRGVPKVRCACGNPLGEPAPLQSAAKPQGQAWSSYRPQNIVVIKPTVTVINKITIYDHDKKRWYDRDSAPTRHHDKRWPDKPVPPPKIVTHVPSDQDEDHRYPDDGNQVPPGNKPDDTKPDETKPDDTKPDETKPDETKPDDTKPDETKPDDTKPDETKPDDTKPDGTKPGDTKPGGTTENKTDPGGTTENKTDPGGTTENKTDPGGTTENKTDPGGTTENKTDPG